MTTLNRVLIICLSLIIQAVVLPQWAEAKGPGGGGGGGKPIKVGEPFPNIAFQGDQGKHILLTGSNFPGIAKVTFLFNQDQSVDDVTVLQDLILINDDGYLEFDIDVELNADLGEYDILVEEYKAGQLSGRKGKGTTLFSVQEKSNTDIVNCAPFTNPLYDPFTDPIPDPPLDPGRCTCEFALNDESGDAGTPPGFIYNMIADCDAGETLVIPQFGNLSSQGAVNNDGPGRKTLRAVNWPDPANAGSYLPFQGEAIIENTGHRAVARHLDIVVAPGVEAGCGGGIHTAVRFVLDGGSPDPTKFDPDYRHSIWRIAALYVSSPHEPLCQGIEARRDLQYPYPIVWGGLEAYDARLFIADSWIMPGSYEKIGILFEGFHWWSGALNPPEIGGNRIDHPADILSLPVGLAVGGITSSDPLDPVSSLVHDNSVNLSGSGVGILAYGAETTPRESVFRINKNTISGVGYGIVVDSHVDDVNFTGNILTGDDVDNTDDIPICTEAVNWSQKGKPNRISDWSEHDVEDNSIRISGCLPP